MKPVNMKSKWECTSCNNIITVQETNNTTKDSVKCSCGTMTTGLMHREVLEIQ